MLEEVLRYINNRFERDCIHGMFAVESGGIAVPEAVEGQYFWVEGSKLNDGLHLYPASDMVDEEFTGRVWLLSVPKAVVDIADEIGEWNEANASVNSSPLQSESFGGYSYSKASGGTEGNELPVEAWKLQFGSRLRPFRKLSRNWI